jgi:hypothetical protein
MHAVLKPLCVFELQLRDPASSPDDPHGQDDRDGIDQQHLYQDGDVDPCLVEGRSHRADHDTYLQHRHEKDRATADMAFEARQLGEAFRNHHKELRKGELQGKDGHAPKQQRPVPVVPVLATGSEPEDHNEGCDRDAVGSYPSALPVDRIVARLLCRCHGLNSSLHPYAAKRPRMPVIAREEVVSAYGCRRRCEPI